MGGSSPPPPPPPPGGAELLEVAKKSYGLNQLAPKAPEKNCERPKALRKFGPITLEGGGVQPPPPSPRVVLSCSKQPWPAHTLHCPRCFIESGSGKTCRMQPTKTRPCSFTGQRQMVPMRLHGPKGGKWTAADLQLAPVGWCPAAVGQITACSWRRLLPAVVPDFAAEKKLSRLKDTSGTR